MFISSLPMAVKELLPLQNAVSCMHSAYLSYINDCTTQTENDINQYEDPSYCVWLQPDHLLQQKCKINSKLVNRIMQAADVFCHYSTRKFS